MKNTYYGLVLQLISKFFVAYSKPQQKNFADVITALFYNDSFSLRDISKNLEGETTIKKKLKRFIYFLDSLTIDKSFWHGYIQLIFSLPSFKIRSRKYITLLFDATTLKDDVWILAVSISFFGRSIPLYLKTWKDVNVSYNYWERVLGVIKELESLLPKGYKYVIIADRGFQGKELIQVLQSINWDFIIRLNENYLCKTKDGTQFVQLSLFNQGLHSLEVLGKTNSIANTHVVVKKQVHEDGSMLGFYLHTSLDNYEDSLNFYSQRMHIEETFKDLKSALKWETYTAKLPEKNRLEKTVIISCLSYAIQLSAGYKIELPPNQRKETSIFKRFKNMLIAQSKKATLILYSVISVAISNDYKYFF